MKIIGTHQRFSQKSQISEAVGQANQRLLGILQTKTAAGEGSQVLSEDVDGPEEMWGKNKPSEMLA